MQAKPLSNQRKVLLSRVVIIRFLVVVVVIGDRVVSSLNQLDRIFFLASIKQDMSSRPVLARKFQGREVNLFRDQYRAVYIWR